MLREYWFPVDVFVVKRSSGARAWPPHRPESGWVLMWIAAGGCVFNLIYRCLVIPTFLLLETLPPLCSRGSLFQGWLRLPCSKVAMSLKEIWLLLGVPMPSSI